MVGRSFTSLLALALALPLIVAIAPADGTSSAPVGDPCDGVLCAGAASLDMTWNVGSGPGQLGTVGHGITADQYDPHLHSWKMEPSDGIQSRLDAKAVVLRGGDGTKIAYVKTDVYLQQDLLTRRVVELVTGGDPTEQSYVVDGLDAEGIMLGGTHNHSAPHYTSTAWGVWIFADVLDLRAFDAVARSIAASIKDADEEMRPATVGASAIRYDDIQQNILGPGRADDGTPAGFPRDHFDDELAIVRIDEAATGDPIAAIVNLALHPESIGGGADLISADFTGVVEREVERSLGKAPGAEDGPVVAWAQSGLGDVEPDSSRANAPEEGREYWRRDFAQAERMSLELADAILATWNDVTAGDDDAHPDRIPERHVAASADVPIDAVAYRFPGPPTHPLPTVSNCRTDHLGVPVLGFPNCLREFDSPEQYQELIDRLDEAGFPVPENVGSAPSYGAVHEGLTLHLQVLRIGDIVLAACPCEAVSDMAINFRTRADTVEDNMHLGFEWPCEERDDGLYCGFGSHAWQPLDWQPVDRDAYERMRAQVRNDATGWETDLDHLGGEAEPADPAEIKGNFTHDELSADSGFAMPLMVGTANDYVGYVVTYREYQRGDHYRKALTPFGPRTADYINTRLVEMVRELRGGPSPQDARDLATETLDDLIQTGKVVVFGQGATGLTEAYQTVVPDDGGEPGLVVAQPPAVIERFDAATFTWQGGSNFTDQPRVVVERLVEIEDDEERTPPGRRIGRPEVTPPGSPPGRGIGRPSTPPEQGGDVNGATWQTVASQTGGEVVVTLRYHSWEPGSVIDHLTGELTYEWTATFEVFDAIEPGTYRFVVDGQHRDGGDAQPYKVTSEPFEVDVWRGIEVTDLRVDSDAATFAARGIEASVDEAAIPGPVDLAPASIRYPFTHDRDLPFISHDIQTANASTGEAFWRYCFRCTFRGWAHTGQVIEAAVTIHRADGSTAVRPATYDAGSGRWIVDGLALSDGETVTVEPGQIFDENGNTNGTQAVAP